MGSSNYANDAVDQAVAAGRKSAQLQRALRAAALGLAVILASLTALLLVGTAWFPAPLFWLGVIGGIGGALASWRSSRLSSYEIARILDRRWNSNDQVSTAYHFAGGSGEAAEVVRAQRELAVSAVSNRDAAEALPLKATPVVWVAAALLLAVMALTGLRYSVAPTLVLESALTPALLSGEAKAAQQRPLETDMEQAAKAAANDKAAALGEELAEAREQAESVAFPFDPAITNGEDASLVAAEAEGLDTSANAGDELDFQQSGDPSGQPGGEQDGDGDGDQQGSDLDRSGDTPEKAESDSSWSEKSNSLLDRLKDALKQMRENMSSEPSQASAQEGAAATEEGSDSAASPESGKQQPGDPAAEGEGAAAEASMDPGEPQEGAQQASQGSGSDSGAGSEGEGDSAGAAGDGDGSKEIQQQQAQDAAFEALEEFYLQRAEELSGDVLVETNTGEISAAATPYKTQQAGGREGAGVAVRDEAPAAYQTFVENYFREIRSK